MTPRAVRFYKMEATGNAFVLVDASENPERDWPSLAVDTADPHFGVGHDGLLVVEDSDTADFRQRMFNPDGTEDMCGNGLRCTAKHLYDTGRIGEGPVAIETLAGVRTVQVVQSRGMAAVVRADLGRPDVRALQLNPTPTLDRVLPRDQRAAVLGPTYVSFGTPHVVVCADYNLPGRLWESISREIEHHPDLGERVTATWFLLAPSGPTRVPHTLSARFWERSVGETLACGTGAAAATAVALARGLVDGATIVNMRGGSVEVSRDDGGRFRVTGEAVTVFSGTWEPRERDRRDAPKGRDE